MTRCVMVLLMPLLLSSDVLAAVEQLTLRHDGLQLSAEIHLPESGTDLPGIVLIQGAGASGVDNQWARMFAEHFSTRGFAVLLPDKRGVGASEGDWRSAGFDELAGDAVATLHALERHPRVAQGQVGFMGLSQGGHIAPLAAAQVPGIPFVVNVVGSLVVMEEQLYHELRNAYLEHELDEDTIAYLQEFAQLSFDYLRDPSNWSAYLERYREIEAGPLAPAVASWPDTQDDPYWTMWAKIYAYDPLPHWYELAVQRNVPCLVLLGAEDEYQNVPVKRSAELARPLQEDPEFELRIYAGSGHALFAPGTHELRPDMLAAAESWMRTALATAAE